jgi:hypothetical protein
MKVLNVRVSFDLDKVNDALGNTPNVKAEDALLELLRCAVLYEYDRSLEGHVSFSICEE